MSRFMKCRIFKTRDQRALQQAVDRENWRLGIQAMGKPKLICNLIVTFAITLGLTYFAVYGIRISALGWLHQGMLVMMDPTTGAIITPLAAQHSIHMLSIAVLVAFSASWGWFYAIAGQKLVRQTITASRASANGQGSEPEI